jgi:hypothetical protein
LLDDSRLANGGLHSVDGSLEFEIERSAAAASTSRRRRRAELPKGLRSEPTRLSLSVNPKSPPLTGDIRIVRALHRNDHDAQRGRLLSPWVAPQRSTGLLDRA